MTISHLPEGTHYLLTDEQEAEWLTREEEE
jgi:hypothetical protein